MLVPFILLLSAWGISCDPFECMEKERANCDLILLSKDFPETVEELRTICSNVNKFATCMTQVYESCEYGEDFLNKVRKRLDFMSSICDEDHPIFKEYGTQNPGQQLSKDSECDCEWRYLKHYEAKGCRPVYEEKPDIGKSECTCPWRFDCSQADEVNSDEKSCVYKKHVYPVGSKIPTTNTCQRCSCTTDYFTQAATITCITNGCLYVYLDTTVPEGCYYVYEEKECCPTVECPAKEKENTYRVPICEYKGKMYYEGEQIFPDENPCLTCLCNSNWTGINSTTCRQYDCMLERHSRKLKQGCIPIYHEKTCCPIEYHCSHDDFEFEVNRGSNVKSEDDEDEMCHFEGRYYPIGHVLDIKHPTHCVTCTCKTPPDFTCIHSSCPPPPNGDYTHCRAVYKPNTCCPDYKCHEKKDYGTQNPGQQLSKDPECDCEWRYFKHYEAKGCRPVYEEKPDSGESECTCPWRFDCSQANEVITDERACVYKKHVYQVGSKILTTNACHQCSCTTDYFTQAATITCITTECLSVYSHTPLPKGCHYVYKEKECCPTVECPAKEKENTNKSSCFLRLWKSLLKKYLLINQGSGKVDLRCGKGEKPKFKVPICEYKGKMYYEGERIRPDEDPCLTCLCNSNWTGINSTTCRQYDCMLERDSIKLKHGCIPIYHEKTCCPIEYHCSDYDFEFKVNRGSNFKSEDDEDEMCHFEGRYYPIGHVLDIKHPTHCVTCTCKTPPDFTCIHSSCPPPPNGDYTNCRSVRKPNTCCADYKCHEKKDPWEIDSWK